MIDGNPSARLGRLVTICVGWLACLPIWVGAAVAADVSIATPAQYRPAVAALAGAFHEASGHRTIVTSPAGDGVGVTIPLEKDADVVIDDTVSIRNLMLAGRLRIGTHEPIARMGLGIAAPRSSAPRFVGTDRDFVRLLRAAQFIVFPAPTPNSPTGIHVARTLRALEIETELQHKIRYAASSDVLATVDGLGRAAIGIAPVGQIIGDPRATLVGPLPARIQSYTPISTALSMGTSYPAAATAFMAFLHGPRARDIMRENGWEAE